MKSLIVSEVFGPTVQGEGPSAGRRCAFVRLGRCNLDCRWCDTPFTWDWQGKNGTVFDPADLVERDVATIVEQIAAMDVGLVVISGGEPMLQREGLTGLIRALLRWRSNVGIEIETNGTQKPWQALRPARYNVSPKLSGSGVARERAWVDKAIRGLRNTGAARFKFVVGSREDFDEVATFCAVYGLHPGSVWLMAQTAYGACPAGLAPTMVAEWAIGNGYNYSDRLHVRLWGDERGR